MLAVILGGWTTAVSLLALAEPPVDRQVVILQSAEGDGRLTLTRSAIAFWNQVLADLRLPTRLVETTLIATQDRGRLLENYTRQVWQQAGRLPPGATGPREPSELSSLGADIVVFLSAQPTMSFAWPLRQRVGFFVAIPAEPVGRNVIAHELGHALGLSHHNDPSVLMCSPCRAGHEGQDASFLPLTDSDRLRLRELYGVAP